MQQQITVYAQDQVKMKYKKTILSIIIFLLIAASIFVLASSKASSGDSSTDYSYTVLTDKTNADIKSRTIVSTQIGELKIESEDTYNLCKSGNSPIKNLNCRQATYSEFIANRVREIIDRQMVNDAVKSIDIVNMSRDIGLLQTSVESLQQENKMLKEELCKKDNGYGWCEG